MILVIFLLFLVLLIVVWLLIKWKRLKLDCVTLITGGVKTGKTTLSVHLAIKEYKKAHRKWWFKHYFLFRNDEEPLLYSNIPLTCTYVPLTQALLERKERFRYKSVCYICETSLVADSMSYKDDELNERLTLLIKLFGHETHGGKLFLDTQAVSDNHYAVKRCISRNLYIYHLTKWIPFVLLFRVRELFYSEDNSMINVANGDIEDDMKYLLISKRVWKKFDCYAYSSFTDDLKVVANEEYMNKKRDLKVYNLISFKKYKTLNRKGENIDGDGVEKREKNKS